MKKLTAFLSAFCLVTVSIGQTLDIYGNPASGTSVVLPQNNEVKAGRSAHPATVVHVIPSPIVSTYVVDIAFDGEQLWVEGYNEYFIRRILRSDGSVTKSIPSAHLRPGGLTFDGNHLWLSESDLGIIEKIDTLSGAVLATYGVPRDTSMNYSMGLAWDGVDLWNNDPGGGGLPLSDSSFKFTTAGVKLQGYTAKGNYPTGLAFDGSFLWSCDNLVSQIYKIDPSTFLAIDTIDAPGGAYPNGLAYDGQYLWVANNDSDSIYALDISNTATGISDHSSVNKLRAFPNPFSTSTTILTGRALKNAELIVFDILGNEVKHVYDISGNAIVFKREELKCGAYFFRVIQNNELIGTERMIISE